LRPKRGGILVWWYVDPRVRRIMVMSLSWDERLSDLFGGLGQDPIEDAPSIMRIFGTQEEREGWLATIAAGIAASKAGDPRVVEIINQSGYRITDPSEAASYFEELRDLYLREAT
jgi:hypothetical protein